MSDFTKHRSGVGAQGSDSSPQRGHGPDARAACIALERPLTALSGLVEAAGAVGVPGASAAGEPHQPAELRALLERVGRQAAAVQELVTEALANPPTAIPITVANKAPCDRDDPALPNLTSRENEVLALVAEGMAGKEIAHSLGITSATVRSHVQHILTKLGVCSRREAAALLTGRLPSVARARLRTARRPPAIAPASTASPADHDRQLPHTKPNPVLLAAPEPPTTAAPHRAPGCNPDSHLTRRELQVLRFLAAGLGRAEIAERLYVSPHTARTHIQRVLSKLGVHSTLGAMAVARDVGLAPAT